MTYIIVFIRYYFIYSYILRYYSIAIIFITYEVMKNFYSILGCAHKDFSNCEIKQIYFDLLKKLHPDKIGANYTTEEFDQLILINQAWFVLRLVIYYFILI